jgi:hypothetical protein
MSTRYRDEDDEQDEPSLQDWEAPDESDADDDEDDDSDTVPCPYCRRSMSELADVCPHCGSYISQEDAPRRHPWWIVAGVVTCLAIVILLWVF